MTNCLLGWPPETPDVFEMVFGKVVFIAIGSVLPLHLVLQNLNSKSTGITNASPFPHTTFTNDDVPLVSFVTIQSNTLPVSQVCTLLQQLFELFDNNVQKIVVLGTTLSQNKIVASNLQDLPSEIQHDFVQLEAHKISISETILRYTLHFALVSQILTDMFLVPFQKDGNITKRQELSKKLLQTLSTAIRAICQRTTALDFQEGIIETENLYSQTQHSEGSEDMIYL